MSHSQQRLSSSSFLHIPRMALSASPSCRFSQPVGLGDKSSGFLQETTLSSHNSSQQVNRTLQGQHSSYQHQQISRTLGTGSANIPGFTAPPEVSLNFSPHMRSGYTQDMIQLNNRSTSGNNVNTMKERKKSSRTSKSTYKHVPHREKPAHLVARRNARERRRVQVSVTL